MAARITRTLSPLTNSLTMNNWYLKFMVFGFLALGVGMLTSWVASFFFWQPQIQKGAGFFGAGISIIATDFAIRRKIDGDGVYQEVYLIPFLPIRIPAWLFGVIVGIGGIVLLVTGEK